MKYKELTIYHTDGTEEIVKSRIYDENILGESCMAGGITAIGYYLYLPDDSQILVQPTLHRKIKIREIKS